LRKLMLGAKVSRRVESGSLAYMGHSLIIYVRLHSKLAARACRETPAFRAVTIEALSTGVRCFRYSRVVWILADNSIPKVRILARI
jgi:hypothetical protein